MAKKKSAFVLAGESNKEAIRTASKTVRSSIATNEDIIAAYELQEGSRVSVICKVVGIKADVHEKGDFEGQPYVSFNFSPTSGTLKNALISNFMPCYDRKNPAEGVSETSMEWIFRELQGLGFETEGWTLTEVEEAAEEVGAEKPMVALGISCAKIKSGKNRGQLAINVRINRLIKDVDGTDDGDDEDGADEAPEAPVTPPKSSSRKAVQETPEVDSDDADDAPEASEYVPAVDDKVLYVYKDDGEEEELECTVVKVNVRGKTVNLSDGEYGYEKIPFAEVTPVE